MQQTVSIEEYQKLQVENAALKFELDQLKRMLFGGKSERFYGDEPPAEQLNLFNVEKEETPEEKTKTIPEHQRKITPRKKPSSNLKT